MSDEIPKTELPETGDWKVTEGSKKTTAVDVTGQHAPRFVEGGKLSSRTKARLQPAPPRDKAE